MGSVLVLEDEAVVLEATTALLQALGHETYPARTSEDALKTLTRHPGIDVILADVTLGNGDSGVLLARRLAHSAWPGSFVFVSGDSEASLQAADRPPHSLFLRKPYGRKELIQALATARGKVETPHD